jgi:hypothetical protein
MTAAVFIFMFTTVEFIFATIAWKGFGEKLWHKLYQLFIDQEQQPGISQQVAAITEKVDEKDNGEDISSADSERSISATTSEKSD